MIIMCQDSGQSIRSSCPVSVSPTAGQVFHVAKGHAAATFPVPDGWQPPHFRDEETGSSGHRIVRDSDVALDHQRPH